MTIEGLKKQIEKAWKMVAASHEKVRRLPPAPPASVSHTHQHVRVAAACLPSQEVKATETIQKLKNEIAQLSRLVEKSAGLVGQGNTVEELLKVC